MELRSIRLGIKMVMGLLFGAGPSLFGITLRAQALGIVHPALWPDIPPAFVPDTALDARIDRLLSQMTLEQKAGQLQADIGSITPDDLRHHPLGSILNGGSSSPGNNEFAPPSEWLTLADRFYEASMNSEHGIVPIPTLWGTDAVHGHNNIVGATIFPHNIGLGAAHDPELIRQIGDITASEVRARGIDWGIGPTLAVAGDDRCAGLDGGTGGHDQGNNPTSETELRDIHSAGYPPAVVTGCTNIRCAAAINAGMDIIMAPDSWKQLYTNTLAQARSGKSLCRGSKTPSGGSCL